jgi:phospholipid/cholesterol/gamma-HCH transport system permease protein
MSLASIELSDQQGAGLVRLSGRWTLSSTSLRSLELTAELDRAARSQSTWDCTGLEAIDSAGAMLLWRAWGRTFPELLLIRPEHRRVFERIDTADHEPRAVSPPLSPLHGVMVLGSAAIGVVRHLLDFMVLIGQFSLNLLHVLRVPVDLPQREISANLYKSGVRAMPVTALVGFLIGVVLSYLSALQLKQFGADIFIVNIIGLGIVRELGPVLVAILVAGRSGSAMTAQLGVMRVTEEIDALATMGVQRSLRLVFPKVVALTVALPLLVLWSTTTALIGGMVSAQVQLDISYGFFFPDPAARGSGRQPLDRSCQGRCIWNVHCTGSLPFWPAGTAKYGKPVHEHDGIRGDCNHRGDHSRRHFRHRHPQHRTSRLGDEPTRDSYRGSGYPIRRGLGP